jgi:molybdate transport system ATP-binding protein
VSLSLSVRTKLSSTFTLDVTMEAPPGITIVFGASGSGKSTLLRSVAGLIGPEAGSISEYVTTKWRPSESTLVSSWSRVSVGTCRVLRFTSWRTLLPSIAASIVSCPDPLEVKRVKEMSERPLPSSRCSPAGLMRFPVVSVSAALARSLVTTPTAAARRAAVGARSRDAVADHGRPARLEYRARHSRILYVTHAHREVFALGDRVVVLDHGRLVASGVPHEVLHLPEDEGLARIAGFENVFDAVVTERRPDSGTMRCTLTGSATDLEVPLSRGEPGAPVRVAIRAATFFWQASRREA